MKTIRGTMSVNDFRVARDVHAVVQCTILTSKGCRRTRSSVRVHLVYALKSRFHFTANGMDSVYTIFICEFDFTDPSIESLKTRYGVFCYTLIVRARYNVE